MPKPDKRAVWTDRLRRYPQSGLTVGRFCHREGVSVPSFYQWKKRLAQPAARPSRSLPAVKCRGQAGPAFQQVMLTACAVVTVELPSGVRIELPAQQASLVRSVVIDLLRGETGCGWGDA